MISTYLILGTGMKKRTFSKAVTINVGIKKHFLLFTLTTSQGKD